MNVLSVDASLPFTVETEADAVAEDRIRLKQLHLTIPNPAGGWLNIRHLNWLASEGTIRAHHPALDYPRARSLVAKLAGSFVSATESPTLASATHMRTVRQGFIHAAVAALEPLGWSNLRTFTLMNDRWVFTPEEFNHITATRIKRRLRTHLVRIGITADAGFLLAFIHGEFDPVSRLYTLHFHGITTAEIADLLQSLVGKWGYVPTRTGASPLRRDRINDPGRQLSYLLKSYWPSKGVREMLNGSRKRDRKGRRIPEPYHTQYLLWMDRHRLSDLTVMIGGWSRRKGGSDAMRGVYLSTVEG